MRNAEAPQQLARSLLACFTLGLDGASPVQGRAVHDELRRRGLHGRRTAIISERTAREAVRTWGSKLGESALQKFLNAQRTSVRLMTTALQQKIITRAVARAPARPARASAPEARGKCLEGTCALLSEKNASRGDVANRPWLLPYIAERATGGDRAFLLALIRHAPAEIPLTGRPSRMSRRSIVASRAQQN